jgi:integrase
MKRSHGQGTIWTEQRARGRVVYMGAVRVNGKQHQRLLGDVRKQGTKDGLTRAGAEARLRDIRVQVEAEAGTGVSEDLTLREAGQRYLAHLGARRNLKRATMQDYKLYLARHLTGPQVTEGRGVRKPKSPPFFEARTLASITRRDVDAYVEQKMLEGLAARTIDSHLTLLSAICTYAVEQDWLTKNPTVGVERPRPDDPDEIEEGARHAHTPAEVAAVLRACSSEFDRALLTTAYYTGMRIGELIALTWADVDLVAGRIAVRRSWSRGAETTTKSRKRRDVPLPAPVAACLAQLVTFTPYGSASDRVYAQQESGRVLDEGWVRTTFRRAQMGAHVPVYTMHDTRSTFATILWSGGRSIAEIQAYLGHADVRTTMGYIVKYQESGDERGAIESAFAVPDPDALMAD